MRKLLIVSSLALALGGCGSDSGDKSGQQRDCPAGQTYDSVSNRCVTVRGQGSDSGQSETTDPGGDASEQSGDDANIRDVRSESDDSETDSSSEPSEPEDPCDKDGDGSKSPECGGNDCDDRDPDRSPDNREGCDKIDHNCRAGYTDGRDCSFYAHTAQTLFSVDPFAGNVERLNSGLPNLLDIDTHPDGTLLGIRPDALYAFDEQQNHWQKKVSLSRRVGQANGLAVNPAGQIFVTSENKVFKINASTGEVEKLGQTGNFYSSGDCVVDKSGTLLMTSKDRSGDDKLVLIDSQTAQGEVVGNIGFEDVYGLTAAWGDLYGLTESGSVIRISTESGEGTRIFNSQHRWYGAASTPSR